MISKSIFDIANRLHSHINRECKVMLAEFFQQFSDVVKVSFAHVCPASVELVDNFLRSQHKSEPKRQSLLIQPTTDERFKLGVVVSSQWFVSRHYVVDGGQNCLLCSYSWSPHIRCPTA